MHATYRQSMIFFYHCLMNNRNQRFECSLTVRQAINYYIQSILIYHLRKRIMYMRQAQRVEKSD